MYATLHTSTGFAARVVWLCAAAVLLGCSEASDPGVLTQDGGDASEEASQTQDGADASASCPIETPYSSTCVGPPFFCGYKGFICCGETFFVTHCDCVGGTWNCHDVDPKNNCFFCDGG